MIHNGLSFVLFVIYRTIKRLKLNIIIESDIFESLEESS